MSPDDPSPAGTTSAATATATATGDVRVAVAEEAVEVATEAEGMPEGQETPEVPDVGFVRRLGAGLVRAARETPGLVWCITALYVTLLLAYSLLLPTYRAPDEPSHVDLSHVFSEEGRYPAWDEADIGAGIQRSLPYVRHREPLPHLTADEALPRRERPSIEELEAGDPPEGINQLTQHPPLYYALTGSSMWVIERVVHDPIGSFQLETWLYRLMSVALVAPLPLVIWRCARLLRLPGPVGVAATLVPVAIPQLLHIGSTANNDNLLVLVFALLTPVVLRLADGQLRPRTAVLAGVLTGVGLLTKGFALVIPFWVAAALALALYRGRRAVLRPVVIAGTVYGATAFAVGGWWWVRNVLLYGRVSPSRRGQQLTRVEDFSFDLGHFVRRWGELTTWRFWGWFSWFEARLPAALVVVATVVVVVAVAVACARRDRAAATPVGTRLLLLAPLLLLMAIQFQRALGAHRRTGHLPGLQGRYWFGAVAALSLLVTLGLAHLFRRRYHLLPLCVFAAVVAVQVIAAGVLLGYYWGEPHSAFADRLRAMVAWGPLPGPLVGAGAVLGVLVIAATAVGLVTLALRPPTESVPKEPALPRRA